MLLIQHFTKRCSKCKEIKRFTDFSKASNTKIGFRSHCKSCMKEFRDLNTEKSSEYHKNNYINNKKRIDTKNKEYRDNNKIKESIRSKRYYDKNKKKVLDRSKKYYQSEVGKAVRKNTNHKRRSVTKKSDVTSIKILELEQNAKKCYWCECSLKDKIIHLDHYIPIKLGGSHSISNLVVSCSSCNNQKHAKDPIVFANSIGKLL